MTEFAWASQWSARVAVEGAAERSPSHEEAERLTAMHFEHLQQPIFRYFHYCCWDCHDAEDLTQETFLRLYRVLKNGSTIANVRHWLFKVARRVLLDHLRAEKRRVRRLVEMPGDVDEMMLAADQRPEDALIQSTLRKQVHAAVRGLPRLQRECFHLRTEGMRLQEIGEVLRRDPRRVAEALERATTTLRRRLGPTFTLLADGGGHEARLEDGNSKRAKDTAVRRATIDRAER